MLVRRFILILSCLCLLIGCQKNTEQARLIMPDVIVAVAPFSQPTQTNDLLSGFIPEDQEQISDTVLAKLDERLRAKLDSSSHHYVFLSTADISSVPAKDARGRRNMLVTWAERAKKAGADMILVPQVIALHERVGGKAGVVSAASINEDFYLIEAGEPAVLLQRCHFAEEQKPLANDITRIGDFFKRGGSWITAIDLAAEGMDKAVEEFGL
jgi:hypothetical protein